ncbi:hypothetical protein NDU88_006111 [Pleurodeles waltl]|uniref:Uncharacterized protein n=1 Tax=Pleurodeles waltl TaxID=8319 RepID=A0AAV7MBY7_PLEWA|nr:hypothetical protein NDU88_006111 [Pleurodeles waltl]
MFLWSGILRHIRYRGSGSAPCCTPPSSSPWMLQRQRLQSQAGRGHPIEVALRAPGPFLYLQFGCHRLRRPASVRPVPAPGFVDAQPIPQRPSGPSPRNRTDPL